MKQSPSQTIPSSNNKDNNNNINLQKNSLETFKKFSSQPYSPYIETTKSPKTIRFPTQNSQELNNKYINNINNQKQQQQQDPLSLQQQHQQLQKQKLIQQYSSSYLQKSHKPQQQQKQQQKLQQQQQQQQQQPQQQKKKIQLAHLDLRQINNPQKQDLYHQQPQTSTSRHHRQQLQQQQQQQQQTFTNNPNLNSNYQIFPQSSKSSKINTSQSFRVKNKSSFDDILTKKQQNKTQNLTYLQQQQQQQKNNGSSDYQIFNKNSNNLQQQQQIYNQQQQKLNDLHNNSQQQQQQQSKKKLTVKKHGITKSMQNMRINTTQVLNNQNNQIFKNSDSLFDLPQNPKKSKQQQQQNYEFKTLPATTRESNNNNHKSLSPLRKLINKNNIEVEQRNNSQQLIQQQQNNNTNNNYNYSSNNIKISNKNYIRAKQHSLKTSENSANNLQNNNNNNISQNQFHSSKEFSNNNNNNNNNLNNNKQLQNNKTQQQQEEEEHVEQTKQQPEQNNQQQQQQNNTEKQQFQQQSEKSLPEQKKQGEEDQNNNQQQIIKIKDKKSLKKKQKIQEFLEESEKKHSSKMLQKLQNQALQINYQESKEIKQLYQSCKFYDALPHPQPAKQSQRKNGAIKCYSANTHQGIVRNFNEDRVSIIYNIVKPQHYPTQETWPKCSFFGVYDGHGGTKCADYLKENLHKNITNNHNFPKNPAEACKQGFFQTEHDFQKINEDNIKKCGLYDRSGACALVVLVVNNMCYIANTGDCRAILSQFKGRNAKQVTRDHKPTDLEEKNRVLKAGGNIYQSKINNPEFKKNQLLQQHNPSIQNNNNITATQQYLLGPCRIIPGRLSITRSFGDLEAKLPQLGGNPKVLIADPEIYQFKISQNDDFIIIGSDGIYDNISNEEIIGVLWEMLGNRNDMEIQSPHDFAGRAAETVLKLSAYKQSLDNITAVCIGFNNLQKEFYLESDPY